MPSRANRKNPDLSGLTMNMSCTSPSSKVLTAHKRPMSDSSAKKFIFISSNISIHKPTSTLLLHCQGLLFLANKVTKNDFIREQIVNWNLNDLEKLV